MAKRYLSIVQIDKLGHQEVIFETKRSLRSILSHLVLFVVLILVIMLLSSLFPDARLSDSIPVLKHVSFRWLAVFPSIVLLEMIRKYNDDLYIFGHHRLTHLNGRLSLSYSIPVIKYIDIRSISIYQDVVGRIFNYGDVELSTAAQEGSELLIEGVVAPNELADLIDKLRNRSNEMAASGVQDSKRDFIKSVFQQMSKTIPTPAHVDPAPLVEGDTVVMGEELPPELSRSADSLESKIDVQTSEENPPESGQLPPSEDSHSPSLRRG